MELLQPTPQEQKSAKRSFNFTLLTILLLCFTAIFCFSKMEKTAAETERIAELSIQKNKSETALILARKGKPDYSPITLTDVSSHVLNTSYQSAISARYNVVLYSVNITSVISLSGGQSGSIVMQTSPDNSTWTNISTTTNNTTGTLTLGLNISNAQTTTLSAIIPPLYYYRLTSSGTSTMSIISGREAAF